MPERKGVLFALHFQLWSLDRVLAFERVPFGTFSLMSHTASDIKMQGREGRKLCVQVDFQLDISKWEASSSGLDLHQPQKTTSH